MTTRLAEAGVDAPKLVYQTDLGRLYQGDALDWLRSLPDASVDLVVADPPYGGNAVHWDRFESLDAYAVWCESWLSECHRVLKAGGSCFVCGWSENLAYLKVLGDKLFDGCRWLVWFYRNKHAPNKTDWGRSHESILHFRKGKRWKFNQDAVRVPYNEHTMKYPQHTQAVTSVFGAKKGGKEGHLWQPHPLGAKPRDVFEISVLNNGMRERTAHPTQKPEELIRRLVQACSDQGDLVVDPFGGSGTTFVVCEKLERNWAGVDLNAEYLQWAVDRLQGIEPDEVAHSDIYRREAFASISNRELVRSGRRVKAPRQRIVRDDPRPQLELMGLEDPGPEVVEE